MDNGGFWRDGLGVSKDCCKTISFTDYTNPLWTTDFKTTRKKLWALCLDRFAKNPEQAYLLHSGWSNYF